MEFEPRTDGASSVVECSWSLAELAAEYALDLDLDARWPRWSRWSPSSTRRTLATGGPARPGALVMAMLVADRGRGRAPLDLDVLAALVAIALVSGRRCAAVVADLVVAGARAARPRRARRGERQWWCAGAALVAIALVAAVVAELAVVAVAVLEAAVPSSPRWRWRWRWRAGEPRARGRRGAG